MNRAAAGDPSTQLCDCTVTVAFAGFYMEANLNHLIAELGRESDLKQAYGPNAGLKSKLAFLHTEYIASAPLARKDVYDRLEIEFPGITELANIRNDICHGAMNQTVAQSLRRHSNSDKARRTSSTGFLQLSTAGQAPTCNEHSSRIGKRSKFNHLRDIEVTWRSRARLTARRR